MPYYDDRLQQLQAQVARTKHLEAMLHELHRQHDTLTEQTRELETVMRDEQADVDRLEGRSLAAFFYHVVGKRDEKLTKERQEAYAARVKYDTAAAELTSVRQQLQQYEAELSALQGCRERFEALLKEKAAAIKAEGGTAAEEILRLETELAQLESRKKEINEAIAAGASALETAMQVLDRLGSAERWGTWDLFGGGVLADLAKHSHLDEAQQAVSALQAQLRRFRTELADVSIDAELQVSVDGFLRFADYFFDGLFADWMVLDKIRQSAGQVQSTAAQIDRVLYRLKELLQSTEQEQEQTAGRLSALVRQTKAGPNTMCREAE